MVSIPTHPWESPVLPLITTIALASDRDEVLRFYDEQPSTLNPLYADDLADVRAQSLVFDRIFERSAVV